MKKVCLIMALAFSGAISYGQGSAGMVAHWNMDGGVNDVSGGGHHGHAVNITPAAGQDGVAGHAYYFNGINSMITVPYSPSFNINGYSICATVKVLGFNPNTCQHNSILNRGKSGVGIGTYQLSFSDYPVDADCSAFDSTEECFVSHVGSVIETSTYSSSYMPRVQGDVWYKVVVTFNDTVYKTYVDGVLKATSAINTPGVPIGSSTDSISIGYNVFEGGYEYPFKGVMDDLLFYDHALTDSEVVHYGSLCGSITLEPHSVDTTYGSPCTFSVASTMTSPSYQWQMDTGTGYMNIAASAIYSGVHTATLTVSATTSAMDSIIYRCTIGNDLGCFDTSLSCRATVTGFAAGITSVFDAANITVLPNPSQNAITIQLPADADGSVQLINNIGQIVAQQVIKSNKAAMDISMLPAGLYIVAIRCSGQVVYKKILKQ